VRRCLDCSECDWHPAIADVVRPVFDRLSMADRLSADGGGQQELTDEICDFPGCLPKAGGGLPLVGGVGHADDGAAAHSVSARAAYGSNTSTTRVSSRDRRLVSQVAFWSTAAVVWHACSARWSNVGWLSLTLRSAGHRPLRPPRTFFLTVHGCSSRLAQQSLTAGIFVGLLVAVEMRQHQGRHRMQTS
jgi:hypothetical protein